MVWCDPQTSHHNLCRYFPLQKVASSTAVLVLAGLRSVRYQNMCPGFTSATAFDMAKNH